MKNIIVLLLSCIFIYACQKKQEVNHSTQINTVSDITDRQLLLPDASAILKLYEFDRDENKEAYFRISTISDKILNPAIELKLPNNTVSEHKNDLDDPNYREKILAGYTSRIQKAISDFDAKRHKDSSLGKSECFATIAGEIQQMQKKIFEKNIMLIYSDLQENSDLFNCYSKTDQALLHSNPDKVVSLFNNLHLLPDQLKGFKIFFIYQPKNREDDQRFVAMAGIYQKLLEARGATVKVQADNNF